MLNREEGMIELTIDSIRISLTGPQRILILKNADETRFLPIWIGAYEAEAIVVALQEIEVSRPQTHDLLKNVISATGYKLAYAEITKIEADVFFAVIVAENNDTMIRIDCRPSDAIALALRCHVPLLCVSDMLENVAITEDSDIRSSYSQFLSEELEAEENDDENHLDVFKNFFSSLGSDDENPY